MIVRHPFERLLSAYRDKMEGVPIGSEWEFRKLIAGAMSLQYTRNMQIPFSIFVEYVLKFTKKHSKYMGKVDHWTPFVDLCFPCIVSYKYIGHMETLEEDSSRILEDMGAPPNFKYPQSIEYPTQKTNELIKAYFKNLTQAQIDGLYELYKMDFILFGYKTNLISEQI